MSKKFPSYKGPRTKSGDPDKRTSAGRAFLRRSEGARRGWETRRAVERERAEPWDFPRGLGDDWLVEEPIDEVGGESFRNSGVFLRG